jgi:hypothetical protein
MGKKRRMWRKKREKRMRKDKIIGRKNRGMWRKESISSKKRRKRKKRE